MSDAVDRVLADRQALDRGMGRGLLVSSLAHACLASLAVVVPLLLPAAPPLQVQDGFMVAMPPGGGGVPAAEPPPAPAPQAPPEPAPAPPAPAPKILKPPKETPRKGLPDPAAGRKARPEPQQPARGGAPAGAASSLQTPGLEFGPPGPGVPTGTDPFGDWYLAGVQRKIWMLWSQQVRDAASRELVVAFTIASDGSVSDVQVTQPSGIFLLDQAAQRAILNAGPFGPLPKDYATNRITIRATFRPTQ